MTAVNQDFLNQLTSLAKVQEELAALKKVVEDQKVYIVLVPRAGGPSILTFDTIDQAANHMIGMLNQEVQAFVFRGHRLLTTRGPHRFLVGPGDVRVPLFHANPTDQDFDEEGWLIDAPSESLPISPETHTPPVLIPAYPPQS